ncbi:MAG: bis(5'-nucleosyl)-tetraphosphatase (symmetrical) YqeK [Agathobacter sp.]|nr:bis(5'-nucleosyl)-tetraphosphatase (symmetrical) YqeK [Agathobacter sp.]
MYENIVEYRKKLKKELDKDRYEHTKGVMYTAGCLAMAYGYSIEDAMLAGLLHDCAKCLPSAKKIEICEHAKFDISEVERNNPGLLHAKAGAILAKEKYKVKNKEILHAIEIHTTAAPDMNLLDKIIYIADYIEPNRNQAPRLEYIREIAFKDIDLCIAEILSDTINYLNNRSNEIDPITYLTYEHYKYKLDE